MNDLNDPAWHAEQNQQAEEKWEKILMAFGSDKVREVLLKSSGSEIINFNVPNIVFHPKTAGQWDFQPTKSYVVKWLADESKRNNEKFEQNYKRTLKIQYIALAVTFLAAVAAVTNSIKSFTVPGG
jgi:hypothetical protein